MRLAITGLMAAALAAAAGCGGSTGKPGTVPAGGTCMYKGEPAAEALVVFHPKDFELEKRAGGKPFGKVGPKGEFTLTTYEENDGAPEGEYNVTVEWKPKAKEAKMSLGGEGGAVGADKLGGRYGDQRNAKFTFTVKKGQPNIFELKLD